MVNFLFIAFFQVLVMILAAEILTRRVPATVARASDANRHRMDGTRSRRRSRQERHAYEKLRRDIWASLLVVAFAGNSLVAAVHYFVIPIPLGIKAVTSFSLDDEAWKAELRRAGIDDQFDQWQAASPTLRRADSSVAQQVLWRTWPVILLMSVAWLILSLKFLAWAYLRSLREFSDGVAHRQEHYMTLDIGRLQELEQERMDDSSGSSSADASLDPCQQP